MCRPNCTKPDFQALPRIPGVDPAYREVHGVWMTEEEYRVTGWHSRGTYPTGKGTTEHQWTAPMGGHILWGRRTWQEREGRINAAQERRAADDAYSDAITADIDRRFNG